MLFYKGSIGKLESETNVPVRGRSWNNQDFGTGKPAPSSKQDMFGGNGGVPFHAPVKFKFEFPGAGKPHTKKIVTE